jgi:hypothetical protein
MQHPARPKKIIKENHLLSYWWVWKRKRHQQPKLGFYFGVATSGRKPFDRRTLARRACGRRAPGRHGVFSTVNRRHLTFGRPTGRSLQRRGCRSNVFRSNALRRNDSEPLFPQPTFSVSGSFQKRVLSPFFTSFSSILRGLDYKTF